MSHSTWVLKTEFQSNPRAVLTSNCWTKQLLLTLVCDKQILLQNRDSSSPWRLRCPREEQSPLSQEPPADWQEPGKGNFLSQDASWWQMPLNFRQCQAVSFTRMWGASIRPQKERATYKGRATYWYSWEQCSCFSLELVQYPAVARTNPTHNEQVTQALLAHSPILG